MNLLKLIELEKTRMPKFYIKTYGCQMNERDSEAMAALLKANGYTETHQEEDADVYFMNTCSVREQAERKAIGKMGIMKRILRKKPNMIFGIVGCMVQRLGKELFKQLPHVHFLIGTNQFQQLPAIIKRVQNGENHIIATDIDLKSYPELNGHCAKDIFGMISIIHGCDQFCTYCIVPYTRGRENSRSIPSIIDEAKRMVEHGTKEILLLGQNVTAYGVSEAKCQKNYNPEHSYFADLLIEMNKIDGLERIRFTSPHIKYMNQHFMETACSLPKLCKAFHVPLQSGSNRLLKKMNRGYTIEEYMHRIHTMKELCPELVFTTDVIVGFCGETDEEFNQTRSILNQVGFDMSYIFRYSPREGTTSAKSFADDVPEEVKYERNQILLKDLSDRVEILNQSYQGRTLSILAEGVSKRNKERWAGRTDGNKICNFLPVDGLSVGDMIYVKIERTTANSFYGSIVKKGKK
ncbi:MAG: tRNA (N6-isopentenyl adenosine(37)-C2)-methylthiotransferase MiaB [Lentisphaeria bacterium]